ncbi:MAG TPA: hypothetical protein VFC13_18855, partial [Actinomycetes bacterium]|nr:hypothetical protein [Actinomycetes bacterium]
PHRFRPRRSKACARARSAGVFLGPQGHEGDILRYVFFHFIAGGRGGLCRPTTPARCRASWARPARRYTAVP